MTYALTNQLPELVELTENANTQYVRQIWEAKRSDILRRLLQLCGGIPEPVPVRWEFTGGATLKGNIEIRRLTYGSYDDDQVSANLLIPANYTDDQPLPAVLALHQTSVPAKEEVCGLGGDPELAYGLELAERGFIVLAPDTLTTGERVLPGAKPFQTALFEERYPAWSMIGKMIYDHRQAVELLCSLDFVDHARISAIGHSLGGYNAFLLSAIDERVKAIVVSCGLSTFAGDPDPWRWGLRKSWFTHFPQLNDYLQHGQIPFEFHEIFALTFPRPAFLWYTQNDAIFPHWEQIGQAAKRINDLYAHAGAGHRFAAYMGHGRHEFPQPVREMAYRWLETQLK